MTQPMADGFNRGLAGLDPADPEYATRAVDAALATARAAAASDIHFQPTGEGLELKLRLDGVLLPVACFPSRLAVNITARLKVLAGLLTYHTDRPQEGRIRLPQEDVEMRVCTFPTLHGERTVVRLFGGTQRYQHLDDLGLPDDVLHPLRLLLSETSGAILVSGAGGKRQDHHGLCLSPRDRPPDPRGAKPGLDGRPDRGGRRRRCPIASASAGRLGPGHRPAVPDAAGSRGHHGGRDFADRPTAEASLQASLTGHLLLSTFHAGSAAETVGRLLDMGLEPYVLRSGLLAILNQRLLRRLCSAPARRGARGTAGAGRQARPDAARLRQVWRNGLSGPVPPGGDVDALAQRVGPGHSLARCDTSTIEQLAAEAGMVGRWQRACRAVEDGLTSPAEVRRVLGFAQPP